MRHRVENLNFEGIGVIFHIPHIKSDVSRVLYRIRSVSRCLYESEPLMCGIIIWRFFKKSLSLLDANAAMNYRFKENSGEFISQLTFIICMLNRYNSTRSWKIPKPKSFYPLFLRVWLMKSWLENRHRLLKTTVRLSLSMLLLLMLNFGNFESLLHGCWSFEVFDSFATLWWSNSLF